jgi:hypothetical protein
LYSFAHKPFQGLWPMDLWIDQACSRLLA